MRTIYKKIISTYIIFIFLFLPLNGIASADGGFFRAGYDIVLHVENSQYAVINYKNGIEKMYLTVDFNWGGGNKSVWLLPIPSKPELVNVSVVNGGPIIYGEKEDIVSNVKNNLEKYSIVLSIGYLLSVVIPMPIILDIFMPQVITGYGGDSGAIVHQHEEKYGFVLEIISAKDGQGIYNYLISNDLEISEGTIPQIDIYVEKNYSFMAMWLSESKLAVRQPGIIISFPTSTIFYPLILTSIYGEREIPTQIIISGYVTPKIYDDIKPYCIVDYYKYGDISIDSGSSDRIIDSELGNLRDEIKKSWEGKYTYISINAPSSSFTEDLWIVDKVHEKVEYAEIINLYFNDSSYRMVYLFFFLTFSLILSTILGLIIISRKSEELPFYFLIGLCNLIGIIGLIIGSIIMKKFRKYDGLRTSLFFFVFILIFLFSIWITFKILLMPLT